VLTQCAEHGLRFMIENGVSTDFVSYSTVVHTCTKSNNLHRAEGRLEQMRKAGVQANTVTYNSFF